MAKSFHSIPMPESFAKLFFVTQSHLGGAKVAHSMKEYIFAQRPDDISIFDIEKSWEKFILAARAIAAIKFPETICAVSSKTFGRKPVLKFSEAIGCKPITSRFIPGLFTNTAVKGSIEPNLIIVSDPDSDKQAIMEATLINCPVIAFCNTTAILSNVDIAIPVNNRSPGAIGASFFILSRLVNYIKYGDSLEENIKNVELFFFRDANELEKLYEEHVAETQVQFAPAATPQMDEGDFGRPAETVESDAPGWD